MDADDLIKLVEEYGKSCHLIGVYAGAGSELAAAAESNVSRAQLAEIRRRITGHRWTSSEVTEYVGVDNGKADLIRDLLNGDINPWAGG